MSGFAVLLMKTRLPFVATVMQFYTLDCCDKVCGTEISFIMLLTQLFVCNYIQYHTWVWVFYVTIDGQSASLSSTHLGLTTRCLLVFKNYGPVFVGPPLWPCQRSLSRIWVPLVSWQYFTVSDTRLPFSSPPTTRRITVEAFDPAEPYLFEYCVRNFQEVNWILLL
jgi:hypothetical protein